ncbi:metallophosphoesterase [Noviherbaspirillum sp. CPCC 100848]|uniref:Metallophosphoesterase n=1 Tax=Noviherbaspirillum album TaxID=3080276 RepID=A0ABU6J779_9BURK|nr:metallophosphoesterase [Noviherbaspirillum sp. CPCC 100848]MEC4719497.1 metallophosphoesterase [Noviherbaspirillum sp. CPCC 100848]
MKLRALRPNTFRIFPLAITTLLITSLSGCISDRPAREEAEKQASLSDKGVTVYAAGDIADCKQYRPQDSGAAKTAALVSAGLMADREAAVLTLGDHTYPVGLLEEFTGCYDATWGKFKDRTHPSPGNHEYYTPQATGYYRYFGNAAGPHQSGYYSFRIGSWHVISLNSYLKPEEHSRQLAWLRRDLAANPSSCTLAYWHHPLYSSGGHGSSKRMQEAWRILHAAGAELVLAAHDHGYERFAPQDADGQRDDRRGVRQFVVGTGGAQLTPFRFRKSHSQVSDNTTLGVLKLNLKEKGYEWEFLPVEKDGFSDRGATLCH